MKTDEESVVFPFNDIRNKKDTNEAAEINQPAQVKKKEETDQCAWNKDFFYQNIFSCQK